jgi:thymidylate synthase
MVNRYQFEPLLGVAKCENFSEVYPIINEYLMSNKEWEQCRDGNVKEILDFKTVITNPYRRLVGGYNRNINPFFLLAEAMWIFVGRKDVKFLTLFNKNMENFSDDGKVFHAPYGFRLRHWGVRSEDKFCEENLHAAQGYDQIADAVKMFDNNPNTRQVVLSIWNPDFDLGTKTKDIPCNDIVMLKIRDGKLITTVQNRSNDLHWGLPTNVFQFSFMTEIIAACLGIELGIQTHNSQSLHVYDWNKIAETMRRAESNELYSEVGATERRIDFNFSHEVAGNRLREVDYYLNVLIDNLERISRGADENEDEIQTLEHFSTYLHTVYKYLRIYLKYKAAISVSRDAKTVEAEKAMNAIIDNAPEECPQWDVSILAANWFAGKLKEPQQGFLGKL